jgi:hypothetical protein
VTKPLVVDISEKDLKGIETLFPPQIEEDSWVLYHGTSSLGEQQIDSEGLCWKPAVCSREDIESLVDIYKKMCWAGISGGGLAVLQPFTLDGDFQAENTKPLYFREDSLFPLLYATRDFSGGETARAVRHALHDLDQYFDDSAVREGHLQSPCTFFGGTFEGPVDLDRLADAVARLSDLRKRCFDCQAAHQHGVVYAVRFTPEDLPALSYSSAMGIRCFKELSPSRIVAKARLHATDHAIRRAPDDVDMFARVQKRRQNPEGLLGQLKETTAR